MAKGYRPLPVEDPDCTVEDVHVDVQHDTKMPQPAVSVCKSPKKSTGLSKTPEKSIKLWLFVALGGSFVTVLILVFGLKAYSTRPLFQGPQYFDGPEGDMFAFRSSDQILRNVIESTSIEEESQCSTPSNKVGFAKTHKTASSTVQNIIFRYGLEKGWNIAMYTGGTHLGPPKQQYHLTERFQSSWLDDVPWKPMTDQQGYNAFAFHTIWDRAEAEQLLGAGARYFTILRSPVEQFESMYNYAHFEKQFKMDLEEFVLKSIKLSFPIRRMHDYLGRNQQFWDLGRFSGQLNTVQDVQKQIAEIEKEFDLVMISEDIDASLVLLADQLCWPLSKMTSLKLNARKKSLVETLSPEARKILKEWLWADEMLYSHFKQLLHTKKVHYGTTKMEKKVADLRKMNSEVQRTCIEKKIDKDTSVLNVDFKPWSKDVVGFKMNETVPWCRYYGMSENRFIDLLRQRQKDRWQVWEPQQMSQIQDAITPPHPTQYYQF